MTRRDYAGVTRLFDGFDLVEPGVTRTSKWQPDSEAEAATPAAPLWAGVAQHGVGDLQQAMDIQLKGVSAAKARLGLETLRSAVPRREGDPPAAVSVRTTVGFYLLPRCTVPDITSVRGYQEARRAETPPAPPSQVAEEASDREDGPRYGYHRDQCCSAVHLPELMLTED
jgi:hypothetical protein